MGARVNCIKTKSQSHFSDNKSGILLNLRIFMIWRDIDEIKMSTNSISKKNRKAWQKYKKWR